MSFFRVDHISNEQGIKARAGLITTSRSQIETPVFMPVGTLGNVKAIEHRELEAAGCEIILGNTYHLYLRPGVEVLEKAGGLHKFMSWNKSILTDSGGFQVFSLSAVRKISDVGVEFASHIDGSKHMFTPRSVIEIQRSIGSDIVMPLDECMPFPIDEKSAQKSVKLTTDWEKECLRHFNETSDKYGHSQCLFSINQGSIFKSLRKQSIESLADDGFAGNAIGGLAVGEPPEQMYEITDYCTDLMNVEKPRYLMGVGTPVDILECVERGVDMFDCVLPTRNARHGRLFTSTGEINLKNSVYKFDYSSPDEDCLTYTSMNFSLSYLRHLFVSKEVLASQLATIHNIGFYQKLMKDIRLSIKENRFLSFKKDFLEKYTSRKRS